MKIIDIPALGLQYSDLFHMRDYLLAKIDANGGTEKDMNLLSIINSTIERLIDTAVTCRIGWDEEDNKNGNT